MEIDRRRSETSYVIFLSLSLSSSHSSSPLYSLLSVYLSHSVYYCMSYVTDLSISLCSCLCCCTFGLWSRIKHTPYVRRLFLVFCIVSFTLHRRLVPFLSSSSSLFIQLKQCNSSVLMQHHANCQKPSGGLSPTLEYSTESNLAGVTEVRLECSHFSTGQILFMLMGSQSKIRAGGRLTGKAIFRGSELLYVTTHHVLFMYAFYSRL